MQDALIVFLILFATCAISSMIYLIIATRKPSFEYKIDNPHTLVFPDHLFEIVDASDQVKYIERVEQGFGKMKQAVSVTFAGLAHNLEHILSTTLQRIEFLGEHFKDYDIVIFENNSTDKTKSILKNWQNPKLHVISQDLLNIKSAIKYGGQASKRFQLMAQYRDEYLNYIRHTSSSSTHVIVLDLDLLIGCSLEGLAHSFSYDHNEWDMIACNGVDAINGTYYDPLAYKDTESNRILYHNPTANSDGLSYKKTLNFKKGDLKLVPVKSAFSGLAIYKKEAIESSKYSQPDLKDCEHVSLHDTMIEQGYNKLFINPNMMVLR